MTNFFKLQSKKLALFWQNSDPFFLLPLTACSLTIILIITSFLILYQKLPLRLPLFYSLPWGETQLAAKEQFLILPATLFLLGCLNTLLASQLHPSQLLLRRIIMVSLVFISAIFLTTATRILSTFL